MKISHSHSLSLSTSTSTRAHNNKTELFSVSSVLFTQIKLISKRARERVERKKRPILHLLHCLCALRVPHRFVVFIASDLIFVFILFTLVVVVRPLVSHTLSNSIMSAMRARAQRALTNSANHAEKVKMHNNGPCCRRRRCHCRRSVVYAESCKAQQPNEHFSKLAPLIEQIKNSQEENDRIS